MALLVLPDLAGDAIEDLAVRTFNAWGVGHAGRDGGALLLLAVTAFWPGPFSALWV